MTKTKTKTKTIRGPIITRIAQSRIVAECLFGSQHGDAVQRAAIRAVETNSEALVLWINDEGCLMAHHLNSSAVRVKGA